ncbi:hypothetical protein ABKN59_011486 [Abortiporus biennis]
MIHMMFELLMISKHSTVQFSAYFDTFPQATLPTQGWTFPPRMSPTLQRRVVATYSKYSGIWRCDSLEMIMSYCAKLKPTHDTPSWLSMLLHIPS